MAPKAFKKYNFELLPIRDGNSLVIFIPREFEESRNGSFIFFGVRGR